VDAGAGGGARVGGWPGGGVAVSEKVTITLEVEGVLAKDE
jgi:hypothetical protein